MCIMNSQFNILSLIGYELITPTAWLKKTDAVSDIPNTRFYKTTPFCLSWLQIVSTIPAAVSHFQVDTLLLIVKYLFV